jgi:hypothetical protein
MDAPFWGLLGQWGPDAVAIGLLAWVIWAVLTGRLITRRQLEDTKQDRDYWREAHTTSEGTRSIMAQQMQRILGNADVVNQVLTSLKKAADPE